MKYFINKQVGTKYKLLLENTQEIIIFFDQKGVILDCSLVTSHELGYGDDIYEVPVNQIFRNVFIDQGNMLQIEERFHNILQDTIAYRKNQTCFPVKLKVTIVKKRNKFLGICTATNVSEKREAVQEINNLKNDLNNIHNISSELVARIAHELRTPVNGIMGFSNNLLDMELKPNQKEAVNIIKRCCSNMNAIINDLLDFAKISNNKMIIEQREFDFRNMIQNVVDINIVHINEKGLKLLLDISNDIPDRVIGDEHRLMQILNNLLSNAIKFTSTGQISLEIVQEYQTEQYVKLFFMMIDTGIGITREEKDKLFKSFSQVDSSITRRFGGTGLGLSICKKLVEAMQGTIEVESEKNKGSTFSFSVCLGLPQSSIMNKEEFEARDNTTNLNEGRSFPENTNDQNVISDIDYINRILKEISPDEGENGLDNMKKAMLIMNDLIEKLTICIEMENWEKAEELACSMKNLIPQNHIANSKNILRLLIAVRKENHDLSLAILTEFKMVMLKEK